MSDGLTIEKLEINKRLGHVETTIAASNVLLKGIGDDLRELTVKVTIQNGRVTKLELWKAGMAGAIGIILFLIGKLWK